MKKTVMLVVDFASMRQFLGVMLESADYDVVGASDGTEALCQLANKNIDLVVSDLNMSDMDGITLKNEMRQLPGHRFTPILMLAGEREALPMPEGQVVDGQAWLVKPIRFDEFFATVATLITE